MSDQKASQDSALIERLAQKTRDDLAQRAEARLPLLKKQPMPSAEASADHARLYEYASLVPRPRTLPCCGSPRLETRHHFLAGLSVTPWPSPKKTAPSPCGYAFPNRVHWAKAEDAALCIGATAGCLNYFTSSGPCSYHEQRDAEAQYVYAGFSFEHQLLPEPMKPRFGSYRLQLSAELELLNPPWSNNNGYMVDPESHEDVLEAEGEITLVLISDVGPNKEVRTPLLFISKHGYGYTSMQCDRFYNLSVETTVPSDFTTYRGYIMAYLFVKSCGEGFMGVNLSGPTALCSPGPGPAGQTGEGLWWYDTCPSGPIVVRCVTTILCPEAQVLYPDVA